MKKFGIVEKSWYKNGYHCFVIFTRNGCRCGYIGIPKTHRLYKKEYNKPQTFLRAKQNHKFNGNVFGLLNPNIDKKALSPDMYFSAHMGFTFSNFIKEEQGYNTNNEMWYFGFDCGHCDDGRDYKHAFDLGLLEEEEFKILRDWQYNNDCEVKTLEYCEEILNIIAEEFKELENEI